MAQEGSSRLTCILPLCHPVPSLNDPWEPIMSFAAVMCESDDNLQQVVRLVESGKLEAGL